MPLATGPVLLVLAGLLAGCQTTPLNPTFALTQPQAADALDSMARDPRPVPRPVLILGGYMDPGLMTASLAAQLRRVISNQRFVTVTFTGCETFDACRRHLMNRVQHQLPDTNPQQTVPVDVVAMSMGGLVARYAALPNAPHKRLQIVRLFTISTPHRGAILADLCAFGPLAQDMKSGSAFLRRLNSLARADNDELVPYVWTNDNIVGAGNAAPPGMIPWWLPPIALQNPHVGALQDPRIIADIARRLRDEQPYTMEPPACLPPGATALAPPPVGP